MLSFKQALLCVPPCSRSVLWPTFVLHKAHGFGRTSQRRESFLQSGSILEKKSLFYFRGEIILHMETKPLCSWSRDRKCPAVFNASVCLHADVHAMTDSIAADSWVQFNLKRCRQGSKTLGETIKTSFLTHAGLYNASRVSCLMIIQLHLRTLRDFYVWLGWLERAGNTRILGNSKNGNSVFSIENNSMWMSLGKKLVPL